MKSLFSCFLPDYTVHQSWDTKAGIILKAKAEIETSMYTRGYDLVHIVTKQAGVGCMQ